MTEPYKSKLSTDGSTSTILQHRVLRTHGADTRNSYSFTVPTTGAPDILYTISAETMMPCTVYYRYEMYVLRLLLSMLKMISVGVKEL